SLVVSLSTTPMMCARLLKPIPPGGHGRLYRLSERAFTLLLSAYAATLGWVLRHQRVTLLVMLVTIGLNIYLFAIVPKGFFPQQDSGRIIGSIQALQDMRIGGRASNAQFQYTLQSTDLTELNTFAPRMLAKLRTLEGLRDVNTDQQNRGLQAALVIDRDTAGRLGIQAQAIDDTLYD